MDSQNENKCLTTHVYFYDKDYNKQRKENDIDKVCDFLECKDFTGFRIESEVNRKYFSIYIEVPCPEGVKPSSNSYRGTGYKHYSCNAVSDIPECFIEIDKAGDWKEQLTDILEKGNFLHE